MGAFAALPEGTVPPSTYLPVSLKQTWERASPGLPSEDTERNASRSCLGYPIADDVRKALGSVAFILSGLLFVT